MNGSVILRLNGGTKERVLNDSTKERMLKDYSERNLDAGTQERMPGSDDAGGSDVSPK